MQKTQGVNDQRVNCAHSLVFKLHVSFIFLFWLICIFSIFFNVHKEKTSDNSFFLLPSPSPKKLIQPECLFFWETSPDTTNLAPVWSKSGAPLRDVLSQLLLATMQDVRTSPQLHVQQQQVGSLKSAKVEYWHHGEQQMLQIQVFPQPPSPPPTRPRAHC